MKHISILELFLIFMKLWLLKEEEGKLLKKSRFFWIELKRGSKVHLFLLIQYSS